MELKPKTVVHAIKQCGLLIVPYGIETLLHHFFYSVMCSFNRTLWN